MDPKWLSNTLAPFATKWLLNGATAIGVVLTTQQKDAVSITIGVVVTLIVGVLTKYVEGKIAASQTTKAVDVRTQALVGELAPDVKEQIKVIEKKIRDPKSENPPPMF